MAFHILKGKHDGWVSGFLWVSRLSSKSAQLIRWLLDPRLALHQHPRLPVRQHEKINFPPVPGSDETQVVLPLRRVGPKLASFEQMKSRQVRKPFAQVFRRDAQNVKEVEFGLCLQSATE